MVQARLQGEVFLNDVLDACFGYTIANSRNVLKPTFGYGVTLNLVVRPNIAHDLTPHRFAVSGLRRLTVFLCERNVTRDLGVKPLKSCSPVLSLRCDTHNCFRNRLFARPGHWSILFPSTNRMPLNASASKEVQT